MASHARLQDELTALQAIYPELVIWDERSREVRYKSEDGRSSLILRLPDSYLVDAVPDVISASAGRLELRQEIRKILTDNGPTIEQLDAIIDEFRALAQSAISYERDPAEHVDEPSQPQSTAKATIVVWLHHLLNTNKRKQALSPGSSAVSGYTKPGYPGVLLYTGAADAVQTHVQQLRSLNWQAFQVRIESDEEWPLPHRGVVEVENISEIVSVLAKPQREEFLAAVMKI